MPSAELTVPIVRLLRVEEQWSLAKITDLEPFQKLARSIAADRKLSFAGPSLSPRWRKLTKGCGPPLHSEMPQTISPAELERDEDPPA